MGACRSVAYNAVVEKLDNLLLGSCSFTAGGWEKTFYPPGLKKSGYLGFYAGQFSTVEVDATFYGIPTRRPFEAGMRRLPNTSRSPVKCRNRSPMSHVLWIATIN